MDKIEEKIKNRIVELEKIREETIEKLKIQQQLVMSPIETAIAELQALLPPDENSLKGE